MTADVLIDGVTYSKKVPFVGGLPSQYWGTTNGDPSLAYPGTYAISVDANSNAVAGTFSVPSGEQIVWQAPGIAIISSSGDVVVNGKTFTNAKPWSRVITVPAQ